MHVVLLAPEVHPYYHEFARGMKEVAARVTGIGFTAREALDPRLKQNLDGWFQVRALQDVDELERAVRAVDRQHAVDRVEDTEETLVVQAAQVRETLGLPGISVRTANLCRDKAQMKAFLREHGVPCAASVAASTPDELRAFAEQEGYPVIVKPLAGFGSLHTHRVASRDDLERLIPQLALDRGNTVAVEEYVEGHEGFFDTIVTDDGRGHEFIAHYYPGCLEATTDRRVSPRVAVTNRVDAAGYDELKTIARRVN